MCVCVKVCTRLVGNADGRKVCKDECDIKGMVCLCGREERLEK